MRLILNIIWLVFGGLWMAVGYLVAALISFLLIITIPFGFASLRIASYALVAVRPDDRRQADRRDRRPDRKRHLGAAVRDLAGDRSSGQRGGDGDHDHRHSAGAGQPQTDPGVADAAGQGDRSGQLAGPIRQRMPA